MKLKTQLLDDIVSAAKEREGSLFDLLDSVSDGNGGFIKFPTLPKIKSHPEAYPLAPKPMKIGVQAAPCELSIDDWGRWY